MKKKILLEDVWETVFNEAEEIKQDPNTNPEAMTQPKEVKTVSPEIDQEKVKKSKKQFDINAPDKGEDKLGDNEAIIKYQVLDKNGMEHNGEVPIQIDRVMGFAGILKILENKQLNHPIEDYEQLVLQFGRGGNYFGIKIWNGANPAEQAGGAPGQPPAPLPTGQEAAPDTFAVLLVDGAEMGQAADLQTVAMEFNRRLFSFKSTLKTTANNK